VGRRRGAHTSMVTRARPRRHEGAPGCIPEATPGSGKGDPRW
jgi:hypothetical protein